MADHPAQPITSQRRADALPPPPKEALCDALEVKAIQVEWLAGDGSDRCYYRISSPELEDTFVLMQLSGRDAEALKGNDYEWISVGEILASHGITVPKAVQTLPEYAALITEDYGDTMLEQSIYEHSRLQNWTAIEDLYQSCFAYIDRMLGIKANGEVWTSRSFDREKYEWELNFFQKEFCLNVCAMDLSDSDAEAFRRDVGSLSEFLASYSKLFVHRDYHSRNIMVRDDKLAIIDFQDARFGNAAYDLVSLVFDNYLPFDNEGRADLLNLALEGALRGHVDNIQPVLSATILQRQLKAIGTYGYLTKNKKRGDYLRYVNPAIASLHRDLVFDKRWPFLSGDFIARLAEEFSRV